VKETEDEGLDCGKLIELIEGWFGCAPCTPEGLRKVSRGLNEYVNIQMHIKAEIEGFIPRHVTEGRVENGVVIGGVDWPAEDVKACFEEIRFILKFGMPMGEVGKIPLDWESNSIVAQEIQSRVDALWDRDEAADK